MSKIRLDTFLIENGFASTVNQAHFLIMSGLVLVNEEKKVKPGDMISNDSIIRLKKKLSKYVSRGGEKLEGAIKAFNISVENKTFLDVGVSTGGFSDYCLQNKAHFGIGIDVSYGILDTKLRQAKNFTILEKQNARYLAKEDLQKHFIKKNLDRTLIDTIDLVVMDVSFISVTKILPQLKSLTTTNSNYIILIKPQFECKKEEIPSGGVITDVLLHESIINRIKHILEKDFTINQIVPSPILGAKGNKEFFFWLSHG